jgi:hypothetical protein
MREIIVRSRLTVQLNCGAYSEITSKVVYFTLIAFYRPVWPSDKAIPPLTADNELHMSYATESATQLNERRSWISYTWTTQLNELRRWMSYTWASQLDELHMSYGDKLATQGHAAEQATHGLRSWMGYTWATQLDELRDWMSYTWAAQLNELRNCEVHSAA